MEEEETTHYVVVDGEEIDVTITWSVVKCSEAHQYGDGVAMEYFTEADPMCAEYELGEDSCYFEWNDEPSNDVEREIVQSVLSGRIEY